MNAKLCAVPLVVWVLAACAHDDAPEPMSLSMANPAAVFCEQQGGRSQTRQDEMGNEYGVCLLADGREVDEWVHFRANAPQ